MYICNSPPLDEEPEHVLLSHAIVELVMPKIEMGERLTMEEMHEVVNLAYLQLEEAYRDPSENH